MYLLFLIVFTEVAFDFSDCRNSNPAAQVSLGKILSTIPLNHDVDRHFCGVTLLFVGVCSLRLAAVAEVGISLSWVKTSR